MGIHSDHWIRRMETEHRMIDPFAERHVRQNDIGCRVISYGLSCCN